MDRAPPAKRWDRLSPEARRRAETSSERATFGQDSSAMAQALKKALQATPATANPARTQRLKWRQTPP